MITEDYVSFETAKLLKEKGFDEPCNNRYYETHYGFNLGLDPGYTNSHWEDWYKDMGVRNYSAPTLQMAQKWLREEHKVDIAIYHELNDESTSVYYKCIGVMPGKAIFECKQGAAKYEQAVENAIKWILENLIEND